MAVVVNWHALVAVLPGFAWVWLIHSVARLLDTSMQVPISTQKGRVLVLIVVPWVLLCAAWAAGVGMMQYFGEEVMAVGNAMLYAMLAVVMCLMGMQARIWLRQAVRRTAAFFSWFDKLCYERLP